MDISFTIDPITATLMGLAFAWLFLQNQRIDTIYTMLVNIHGPPKRKDGR